MAATTIQRALTCSPRAVAMIASAIAPRMPTRTQGPWDRRVLVMACSVPVGFALLPTMHRQESSGKEAHFARRCYGLEGRSVFISLLSLSVFNLPVRVGLIPGARRLGYAS